MSVVLREGALASAAELREFMTGKVARWQLPECWAFLPKIPTTSVGKFDKKSLRARHAGGEMDVTALR